MYTLFCMCTKLLLLLRLLLLLLGYGAAHCAIRLLLRPKLFSWAKPACFDFSSSNFLVCRKLLCLATRDLLKCHGMVSPFASCAVGCICESSPLQWAFCLAPYPTLGFKAKGAWPFHCTKPQQTDHAFASLLDNWKKNWVVRYPKSPIQKFLYVK
jgi:hypothetical protein